MTGNGKIGKCLTNRWTSRSTDRFAASAAPVWSASQQSDLSKRKHTITNVYLLIDIVETSARYLCAKPVDLLRQRFHYAQLHYVSLRRISTNGLCQSKKRVD